MQTHRLEPLDSYNQVLIDNVRPESWKNPEPAAIYDMVVIGGGTAGLISAIGAATLGLKTAIIEKNLYGGDCLNFGCVPSKGLLAAARLIQRARRSEVLGIQIPEIKSDFGRIAERMRKVRSEISANDSVQRLGGLGIDVFIGKAGFTGHSSVAVERKELKFRRCIVATGARASMIPIPGLRETGCLTNETLFSLTKLPKKLLIIGGGPIGCEMAQAFAGFGSEVHVFDASDVLLPREERETSLLIMHLFQQADINLHMKIKIKEIQKTSAGKRIVFEHDGKELQVEGDEILLAVGRSPNVEMDLEKAGVEYDARTGVKVDEYLRTTNSRIFAAGDICSVYKFTHAAEAMAKIALQNSIFPKKASAGKLNIPWCTYTHPEVAHAGKYKSELDKSGIAYRLIHTRLSEIDRYALDGETEGFIEILTDAKGRILGSTIIAHNAGELIGYIVQCMNNNLKISSIYNIIYPYPVSSMALKRAAGVHLSARLSAGVRQIIDAYLWLWRRFNS